MLMLGCKGLIPPLPLLILSWSLLRSSKEVWNSWESLGIEFEAI